MATDYTTGFILSKTITGFGNYTGINLVNSGNFPVAYTVINSSTTFDPAPTSPFDTIFISEDPLFFSPSDDTLNITVYPSETGKFYLLNKPMLDFGVDAPFTGLEKSTISIYSTSKNNDDNVIAISVTGQRIITPTSIDSVSSFYAIREPIIDSTSDSNTFLLDFSWSYISGISYATGFKLELCSDSSFTTHISDSPYFIAVAENNESYLPKYGGYSGLLGRSFYQQVSNLSITDSDIYARIYAIDSDGNLSDPVFCTGFDSYDDTVVLDSVTYSGLHPTPGGNLKYTPTILNLSFDVPEFITDFDLLNFIAENNPKSTPDSLSYDFTLYSGIKIFFNNSTPDSQTATITSTENSIAPLSLLKPDSKSFEFNTGENGIFKLELEFNDVRIFGRNGAGILNDAEGTVTNQNAVNGGPIFNFDNFNYNDIDGNLKTFQYFLTIDGKSILRAGVGGSVGYTVTKNSELTTYINGTEVSQDFLPEDFTFTDLFKSIEENKLQTITDVDTVSQNGSSNGGSVLLTKDALFPDIFLNYKSQDINYNELNYNFTTENITGNLGDQSHYWYSDRPGWSLAHRIQSDDGGSIYPATHYDSTRHTPLTVREAYGRRCYELAPSLDGATAKTPFWNGIFKKQQLTYSTLPSYTILVFALGKNTLDSASNSFNNYQLTRKNILSECSKIFKFMDASNSEFGYTFFPYNFLSVNQTSGSVNNDITNLIENLYGGTKPSNPLLNPKFTPIFNANSFCGPYKYASAALDSSKALYPNNSDWNRITSAAKNNADISNLDLVNPDLKFYDKTGSSTYALRNFVINETSGSSTSMQVFLPFFVVMKSEPLEVRTDSTCSIKFETSVNGAVTFRKIVEPTINKGNSYANFQIGFANSCTNSSNPTRMFLFDFVHGFGLDAQKRDQILDAQLSHLLYKNKFLFFRTTDELQLTQAGFSNGTIVGVSPEQIRLLNMLTLSDYL